MLAQDNFDFMIAHTSVYVNRMIPQKSIVKHRGNKKKREKTEQMPAEERNGSTSCRIYKVIKKKI